MNSDQRPTVYIVDDDDMVRDSLKALLEAHRFRVRDFNSAQGYLDARDGLFRGCLLVDMHMPNIDGLGLLQALRTARDAPPVVFYTGRNDPALEARAMAAGALTVLDKPVTYKVLLATIRQALKSSRTECRSQPLRIVP